MTLSRNVACRRLSSLGLRQDVVHKIIDQVDTWAKTSGPEWTVSRLKALKTDFIRQMAGIPDRTPWVAYRTDKTPKGALGTLFRLKGKKAVAKGLNALMVYSSFVSDSITPKQWKKFHGSVVTPMEEGGPELLVIYSETRLKGLRYHARAPKPATLDSVTLGNTSVPMYKGLKAKESEVSQWFPQLAQLGVTRKLAQQFPEAFEGIRPDAQKFWSGIPDWDVVPTMGRIGFIQEPGFKLRAVANPDRILQIALEPLRKELARAVTDIYPTDCTFDQMKGVTEVQKWLKEGHRVHSVDLSDATNNFPLRLQLKVIRRVLGKQWEPWIGLFEAASKGQWSVRTPDNKQEYLTWAKGQPLGLGPSFVSFALTHNYIVACLQKQVGGDFRILGDDIVIRGEELALKYRATLASLGCPISEDKSITSNVVAEFAGKVITQDSVVQPYKWRDVSDRSFLDICRNLGASAVNLLAPRQRKVIRLLAEIPEEYGGLGWNPHGKPYMVRFEENRELILRLEGQRGIPFSSSNSELNRLRLRDVRTASLNDAINNTSIACAAEPTRNDIDMTRLRIMQMIGVHEEVFLESERKARGYKPLVKESDPRGPTTLDSLERKLFPPGYRR